MFPDGHAVGLLQASHHIGFLPFHSITSEDCELVECYAVLKRLGSLHAKSLVIGSVQRRPGVSVRGSGPKNENFSNGPIIISECSNLL